MEDRIAQAALEINAIKLQPEDPFQWASGYRMPIYNDNRLFLFHPELRALIVDGLKDIMEKEGIKADVIAGTSTAGIPHGMALANALGKPFVYIRDKPKGHGLKNQIEGVDSDSDLSGYQLLVIEDLISTGGSSARAVQAVRDANGDCRWCLSIFSYGLERADEQFSSMDPPCEYRSLLTYDALLKVAKDQGYIDEKQQGMLEDWRADPFGWGEMNGFPKVNK